MSKLGIIRIKQDIDKMNPHEHHLEFNSDGLILKGRLHLPKTKNPPLVVGSHGLEGSLKSAKQETLARLLPQRGMAFFRFDHRGCGESQGEFVKETSLEKRTRDMISAVGYVLDLGLTSRQVGLFGSSMGGAACINAWQQLENRNLTLCGAVLCAAPVMSGTIENIPHDATENRPALPLSFFEENLLFDLRDKARALHHLLIFHGDADEVVPVSNGRTLHDAARKPKSFICQKGGGHRMDKADHQAQFEALVPDWYRAMFTPG